MKHVILRSLLCSLLLSACVIGCVADEVSFFGSDSKGMAGAGLAVTREPSKRMFNNPAAVALINKVRFVSAGLTLQKEHINTSEMFDVFRFDNGSATDVNKAAEYLKKFADQTRTRALLAADLGVAMHGLAVTAGLTGDMRLMCNDKLVEWAQDGRSILIPADAKGDVLGLAVISLPDITVGNQVNTNGSLVVGGRLRYVHAYYTHYYADGADLYGGAKRAAELGADDYISKKALGLDAGLIYKPESAPNVSYAVVIMNLLEPDLNIPASEVWGNRMAVTSELKPMKRSLSTGMAYERGKWLAAIDFIDMFDSANASEIRLGAECAVTNSLALRAGYASNTGYAAGVSLWGMNISIAEGEPITLARQFNF